jgi:hypothetical protein
MVLYICRKCKKKFNKVSNYKRHINRKYQCITQVDVNNVDEKMEKMNDTLLKINKKLMRMENSSMTFDDSSMTFDDSSMTFDDSSMTFDDSSMTFDKSPGIKVKNIIYYCKTCKKKFKKKSYLDVHLKKYCKMNINFNNIYKFKKSEFGKIKYGTQGGDMYIIQTDHDFNNVFKIGKTTNLYNRLNSYRCGAVIEPRLYFYYPFKNIKKADNDIKSLLSKFRVKREIFKCDIEELRKIILKYQKKVDNCKIENEPIIKETDLSECEHCDKLFYTKKEMFVHLENCESYRSSFTNNGEYNCNFCNKNFNHKGNCHRHMKHHCKKKKEKNEKERYKKETDKQNEKKKGEELENEILKKKLEEAEKKIEELKKSQVINNYNNITLIAHNKQPDLSHLTDKDYLKIMNRGFNSVPKLIEAIHFNPEKPENQNVYIPNIKNKYAMVWNGDKWVLNCREDIIDDMYDDNSDLLIDKLEQLEESDTKNKILKKFKRFMSKKEDSNIKNKIKEDIKLLLYNNKNLIKVNN